MPRTNQVKKKEEENVSHNERVHVERPGNGGSRVLLSNWKRVCCTDLHKTERGMGWAGGETSARTRGANKPHQSFQVILEMMRRKLLKYLTRKESFIFEWHHQAKTKLRIKLFLGIQDAFVPTHYSLVKQIFRQCLPYNGRSPECWGNGGEQRSLTLGSLWSSRKRKAINERTNK